MTRPLAGIPHTRSRSPQEATGGGKAEDGVISPVIKILYKEKGIPVLAEIPLFIAGVPSRI
jgi:hypothetical protein